tara:strand:- start:2575 stop:3264 length:690 start_codon:yes stop_codon:yes gene_type:complete
MTVSTYEGEEIIASIVIKQGEKHFNKVWMPRTVFNDPQNKHAYILGNGESRKTLDLYALPQDTYGCNALYRDYTPDFLVAVDRKIYKEIIDSEYEQNNIVYTNHGNLTKIGGNSHLIPANPHQGAGPTAMHIAIHDGHTNLICIGFDCGRDGPNNNVYKDTNGYNTSDTVVHQTVWASQIHGIMKANPAITFTYVEGDLPSYFFDLDNCKAISYTQLSTHINTRNEQTT